MKIGIASFILAITAARLVASDIPSSSVISLREEGQTVAISNTEVSLIFDRAKGTLKSLRYREKELLAAGGGYVQIAFTSRKDNPKMNWDYRVVRSSPEFVEIAFVNTSSECPFEFSSHFILRAGESGFHHYLTWGHDASRQPGVIKLAQYNFALRIDPLLFTMAAADDQRITPFPDGNLLTHDKTVMDSTYKLPDGTFYSKYFFSTERDEKHTVYGAMGNGLGIWMIMPSHEHLNGGPEHQELAVHQANASQVLLAHAQGAHYGAGILTSDSKDGSWTKVSAPWFVYVNAGASQAEMWKDARQHAAEAAAAWPYSWLDDAIFQLKRGVVMGTIVTNNSKPLSGARVILAAHDEKAGKLLWQQQWRGYRFYSWAGDDGRFEMKGVRAGEYDLYAWQPGSFGTFVKKGVHVDPGESVSLSNIVWNQPTREILWQIGTPDHSAQEFGFGDNFRQWGLWQEIATKYPEGVNYTIGKSLARDWPFEMAIAQKTDLSWHLPVWSVQFENTSVRSGKAILMLGVAAFEGKVQPQLKFSLNGEDIGSVSDLEISGAAHRSGVHAGYQERTVIFDASKLKVGSNTLVITMPLPGHNPIKALGSPEAALLWDALRLELDGK